MKPEEALSHEWIREGMVQVKARQLKHKTASVENAKKKG